MKVQVLKEEGKEDAKYAVMAVNLKKNLILKRLWGEEYREKWQVASIILVLLLKISSFCTLEKQSVTKNVIIRAKKWSSFRQS